MLKKIGKFFGVFAILQIILVLLLTLSSSIPSGLIKNNVKKSSETLLNEGNLKIIFVASSLRHEYFDNYSDALMINTAYSIDSKVPLYSALTAKKNYIPNVTKKIEKDKVGELSSNSKYENHDEVSELNDTVNGISEESFEYAKYWHGYLIFLRPLLLIFNYTQIRILLLIVFAILAIVFLYLIAKKINNSMAAILGICLFEIGYFYIGISLLNSVTMLIAMISSIIMLVKYEKIKDLSLYFFIIGICVGFFCLLDMPLITFGLPLIVYYLQKSSNDERPIEYVFKEILKFGIFWILGYSLIWISKWILIDVLYGRNIFITSLGQVLYRTSGQNRSGIVAICINLLNCAVAFMINLIIFEFMLTKYFKNISKNNFKKAFPFLIIAVMPIVWYMLLANHSTNHCFFTYRILFLTFSSSLIVTYIACGEPEEKQNKKKNNN